MYSTDLLRDGVAGAGIVVCAAGLAADQGRREGSWEVNVDTPKALVGMPGDADCAYDREFIISGPDRVTFRAHTDKIAEFAGLSRPKMTIPSGVTLGIAAVAEDHEPAHGPDRRGAPSPHHQIPDPDRLAGVEPQLR